MILYTRISTNLRCFITCLMSLLTDEMISGEALFILIRETLRT